MIYDVVIIGAGPCGLACGIEAKKSGLNYSILEKGSLAESIRKYPTYMTFFSTPENISIGNLPFPTSGAKATRAEALNFYRLAAQHFDLNISVYDEVYKVHKTDTVFTVESKKGKIESKNLIIATGYFDQPRPLTFSYDNSISIKRYYDEPYPYVGQKVVLYGGGNSAIEAALDLYRNGVETTVVVRESGPKPTAKYWLKPDFDNRVKAGDINLLTETEIISVKKGQIKLKNKVLNQESTVNADALLALIGYVPDVKFYDQLGVNYDEETLIPNYDNSFETNVEGCFLAGTVTAGIYTEKVFIENGRLHAEPIIRKLMCP